MNERRREIGLHVGELAETLECPCVLLPKLLAGFNGYHLALAQGVYDRDLAVERECGELRLKWRADTASSKQFQSVPFHRDEHAARCFEHVDTSAQEHLGYLVDGSRFRKRGRHVEQLPRQRGNALHFISETLKLRG